MPTYSYRCRDCGVAFDIQQSFDEDSLTVCPQCNGGLRKLFNTVGVVFKGSGFYRTDSRKADTSSSSSDSSGSSGSGGGTTTETTAAPKKDAGSATTSSTSTPKSA